MAGIGNWKILAVFWALIPIGNAVAFAKVPIALLIEEGESGLQLKELFRVKVFWILLIMMICAGASERAGGEPVGFDFCGERTWDFQDSG